MNFFIKIWDEVRDRVWEPIADWMFIYVWSPLEDVLERFFLWIKKNSFLLLLVLIAVVMFFLWRWWGIVGAREFLKAICESNEGCTGIGSLGELGDVFGGINALFAGLALGAVALSTHMTRASFVAERQWARDEKLAEQVQRSLKWAYDVLTDEGTAIPPKLDQRRWSSCAHHLVRTDWIVKKVYTPELLTVVEEHQEFWRRKIYLAINQEELAERHYFYSLIELGHEGAWEMREVVRVVVNYCEPKNDLSRYMIRNASERARRRSGDNYSGLAGQGLRRYFDEKERQYQEQVGRITDQDSEG